MFSRSLSKFLSSKQYHQTSRFFASDTDRHCKLLIVGGGSGGCTVAAKCSHDNHFKKGDVIIIEPADRHYYQPMFTLIGGGIKKLDDSYRLMKDVLPKSATWLQTSAVEFFPKYNVVVTQTGEKICYDYLLIAMGLQLNYHEIPGLCQALNCVGGGVCSNYSPNYVNRTFEALQNFRSGNAIFTYPNTPVKCPGAPQKIMYIAEHYFRKKNLRNNASIYYNSSLGVIFGVKKYANALWKICKQRKINVNLRTNLVEIVPEKKLATFMNLDNTNIILQMPYELLHVAPPMGPPSILKQNKDLTNDAGFLDVNKDTLQHTKYRNIFGIGDCTNTPNSKTAASVAVQSNVVMKNLKCEMAGKPLDSIFNGYASCPLVTGYDSCILAEFDYNLTPMETFPMSQDREMYLMYMLKKDFMPSLYWHLMLNGYWNGPGAFRKIMHPFS